MHWLRSQSPGHEGSHRSREQLRNTRPSLCVASREAEGGWEQRAGLRLQKTQPEGLPPVHSQSHPTGQANPFHRATQQWTPRQGCRTGQPSPGHSKKTHRSAKSWWQEKEGASGHLKCPDTQVFLVPGSTMGIKSWKDAQKSSCPDRALEVWPGSLPTPPRVSAKPFGMSPGDGR